MKELVLDVSKSDAGIDLAAWKRRRGLWGVIIKRGGYEVLDGNMYPEEYHNNTSFANHYANAQAAGLHIGAYYYSIATDPDTMRHNARHLVSLLGGIELDLPVYIDIEEPAQLSLPMEQRAALIDAFCEVIRDAGYIPGVYSGYEGLADIPRSRLSGYAMWVAAWQDSKPKWASDYGMWQQGGMDIDGNVIYGEGDGYHDFDWCYVDYPSQGKNGGGNMAKLSYAMAAAEVMDHFIDHDVHGYSQPNRDGTGEVETITLSDGTEVSFQAGDRDCSRLVQTCNVVVGSLPRGMHMWTGNEREILLTNGFVEVSLDEVQRGDVLWRTGHTEMYLGNGIQGGARQSEYGTTDGQTGDQTGEEIARSAYDRWEWESAYRCVKTRPGEGTQSTPKPQQEAGRPINDFGLSYQAHVQDVGWLPEVRDGQTAGTIGYSKRLEALRFTAIPAGWSISAKAHVQNVGWVDYGTVTPDTIIGSVGKSQAIEMLILDAKGPANDMHHLFYRVHQQNVGWKSVTPQGYASGTDGMSLRLEAVRVWLA